MGDVNYVTNIKLICAPICKWYELLVQFEIRFSADFEINAVIKIEFWDKMNSKLFN